jgi:hypothetical protein
MNNSGHSIEFARKSVFENKKLSLVDFGEETKHDFGRYILK